MPCTKIPPSLFRSPFLTSPIFGSLGPLHPLQGLECGEYVLTAEVSYKIVALFLRLFDESALFLPCVMMTAVAGRLVGCSISKGAPAQSGRLKAEGR